MKNKDEFISMMKHNLDLLNVARFDYLYIYSDFRFFGKYLKLFSSKEEFFDSITSILLTYTGTIIIPTFTYTTSGVFDVSSTKTFLGSMNNWILNKKEHARSEHPLFSFASIGRRKDIIQNVGKSSFGYDSVHDRLSTVNAGFLSIGRPLEHGNTILHYVEQSCGASYRFHKCFKTRVMNKNRFIGTDYNSFLRRRDVLGEDFSFTFKKASKILREKKIIKEVGEDFQNITTYPYKETLEILLKEFYIDQNIFIKTNYKNYEDL